MEKHNDAQFEQFFAEQLKAKDLTAHKLSELTGITLKHIESLLAGRYEKLPPAPYIHGYLLRIGEILDFNGELWWKQLREEGIILSAGPDDELPYNRFSLKPFRKSTLIYGIIIILAVIYFASRFSSIFGVPELTVSIPEGSSFIRTQSSDSTFIVRGTLKNGNELTINNDPVTLNTDGTFEKDVILSRGLTVIEFRAKKFLGRETTIRRTIYWETPSAPSSSPSLSPETEPPSL